MERWEAFTRDRVLLKAIERGVHLCLDHLPPPSNPTLPRSERKDIKAKLTELEQTGVTRRLTEQEFSETRHWTRIFLRDKKDSSDKRLITDLRPLNGCYKTPAFKQDTWATVLSTLEDDKWNWAAKLDLKDFFYHLGLDKTSSRWIRVKVGNEGWQFQALPFGLACSPYW